MPTPDPSLDELRQFCNMLLITEPAEMYEFEREEAIYWFATHNHGGQNSNLYEALCTSQFKPSILSNGPEEGLARELYDLMTESFA